MTKRKSHGGIAFHCDAPDCKAVVELRTISTPVAWRGARAQGWLIEQIGPVFRHYCSWIHRPRRTERAA